MVILEINKFGKILEIVYTKNILKNPYKNSDMLNNRALSNLVSPKLLIQNELKEYPLYRFAAKISKTTNIGIYIM